MSTRDKVLDILKRAEAAISGESIAEQIGISRNAVWKVIEQLRSDGYEIDAVTNRGYCLKASPDLLSREEIQRWRTADALGGTLEIHENIDSTNTRAKKLAAEGAPHGYLVLADSQSGGRGRFGRNFFSPEHSGIYMSLILRPEMPAERAVMITSMAAVAVARAIERVAPLDVKIKWVNDLYINDRKTCGILSEASINFESGQLEYAVLGIGVNVKKIDFPEELQDIATSIGNEWEGFVSRNRLIAEICNELEMLYGQLETAEFMAENRSRSNVIGREVLVLRGSERFKALALDIDEQGCLVIQTETGVQHVGSGEISLKFR